MRGTIRRGEACQREILLQTHPCQSPTRILLPSSAFYLCQQNVTRLESEAKESFIVQSENEWRDVTLYRSTNSPHGSRVLGTISGERGGVEFSHRCAASRYQAQCLCPPPLPRWIAVLCPALAHTTCLAEVLGAAGSYQELWSEAWSALQVKLHKRKGKENKVRFYYPDPIFIIFPRDC